MTMCYDHPDVVQASCAAMLFDVFVESQLCYVHLPVFLVQAANKRQS